MLPGKRHPGEPEQMSEPGQDAASSAAAAAHPAPSSLFIVERRLPKITEQQLAAVCTSAFTEADWTSPVWRPCSSPTSMLTMLVTCPACCCMARVPACATTGRWRRSGRRRAPDQRRQTRAQPRPSRVHSLSVRHSVATIAPPSQKSVRRVSPASTTGTVDMFKCQPAGC